MPIGLPEIVMILILLSILSIPVLIGIGIVWYLNSRKKPPHFLKLTRKNIQKGRVDSFVPYLLK